MNKAQIDILKRQLDSDLVEAIDCWEEKCDLLTDYPVIDTLFKIIDLYFEVKESDEKSE